MIFYDSCSLSGTKGEKGEKVRYPSNIKGPMGNEVNLSGIKDWDEWLLSGGHKQLFLDLWVRNNPWGGISTREFAVNKLFLFRLIGAQPLRVQSHRGNWSSFPADICLATFCYGTGSFFANYDFHSIWFSLHSAIALHKTNLQSLPPQLGYLSTHHTVCIHPII